MSKIFAVHTSNVSYNDLKALFHKYAPDVEYFSIVDDSLIEEVKTIGHITPGIVSRMSAYFRIAQDCGADLIFNQCSSVGDAADIAAKGVDIPVVRIDEAMYEQAAKIGHRIALIATVASTVDPSTRLLKRKISEAGSDAQVDSILVDGAMDMVMAGNVEEHNRLVKQAIDHAAKDHDCIVLAQGSMTAILPFLSDVKVPVLTSPEPGVQKAVAVLRASLSKKIKIKKDR